MINSNLRQRVMRIYVAVMLRAVGRALVATSRVDDSIRAELCQLPAGYQIQIAILYGSAASLVVQKQQDGTLAVAQSLKAVPDLRVSFKHLAHAYLLLSLQESATTAWARGRVVIEGDATHAMRFVRCFDTMSILLLPHCLVKRCIKHYARVNLWDKAVKSMRIYGLILKNLLLLR